MRNQRQQLGPGAIHKEMPETVLILQEDKRVAARTAKGEALLGVVAGRVLAKRLSGAFLPVQARREMKHLAPLRRSKASISIGFKRLICRKPGYRCFHRF
jgi:hypothetical protein